MYGLVLILTLVVMGGLIAYIGDNIGSKVGKRKLTVFGLRPKHTSILVTIVTGIFIAASTLSILALTSNNVRTALFGMEALRTELNVLSREVQSQNVELTASHKALAEKNAEYATLSAKVRETTDRLNSITKELQTVSAERDRAARALEKLNAEYITARKDLDQSQKEIKSLQETKRQLDERVAALNKEKAGLEKDVSRLEQEVNRLNEVANTLKKGIQTVREGSILFRAGEALSAAAIKGGQKKPAVEQALKKALVETNLFVLEKMGIKDKQIDAIWVSQVDFDEAVKLLVDSPQEYVVRVSAAGNTVYGEPVVAQLDLFPNHLIYPKGTTVYFEELTTDRDPKQAEELVLHFLQRVNAQAIKQGILPDPIQGTVGVVSGSHLFETVNKVKRSRDKLELSAVTTEDIYTVGPLQIEIRVRPVQ